MHDPFSSALVPLEILDPSCRVLGARLPSGEWLDEPAISVDPRTSELARVAATALSPADLERLPRCVAAQAVAAGSGFSLTLSFALDPVSGAFWWEILDDHGSAPDADTGVTGGRGVRAWQTALRALKFHATEYGSDLDDEDGDGDDEGLFLDVPDLLQPRPRAR